MMMEGRFVMKGSFEILKLNNEPYDFLVIATSYENPLSFIKEIEEEIQVQKANLLFDLTLINGINKNRYIRCVHDTDINQLPSCSIVENVNDSIKKISQGYFAENEEVIKESIIPDSLKYLLKSGMI